MLRTWITRFAPCGARMSHSQRVSEVYLSVSKFDPMRSELPTSTASSVRGRQLGSVLGMLSVLSTGVAEHSTASNATSLAAMALVCPGASEAVCVLPDTKAKRQPRKSERAQSSRSVWFCGFASADVNECWCGM